MSTNTLITLSKGGTKERTVPIGKITIPNLWHIAQELKKMEMVCHDTTAADYVLECWNLCHDLLRHIQNQPD